MHISKAPQKDLKLLWLIEYKRFKDWNYVKGKDSPADDASRGLDPRKETSSSRWFAGPAFLWQRGELWPNYSVVTCVGVDGPEIKRM